jgi:putative transposase
MGRPRREIQIGIPHHVAHRGNHRRRLFESDDDRRYYIALLYRFSRLTGTHIAGFCLMSNHVHVIAIPTSLRGLSSCFARTHRKYSEHLNQRLGEHGTNWEGRFFSVPMGEAHALNALRYVERNPVEAGLVKEATDWPWSSAQMHCGAGKRWGLVGHDIRPDSVSNAEWRKILRSPLEEEELQHIPWAALAAAANARASGSYHPSLIAGA